MSGDTYQELAALHDKAQALNSAGERERALEHYDKLVHTLIEKMREDTSRAPADLRDLFSDAANEFVDLLRWERRYERAMETQKQLLTIFPEHATAYQIGMANLQIEAGIEGQGLQTLHNIAEGDPENIWGWLTLGGGYLWSGRFNEAETYLQRAATLDNASSQDRALAYRHLFDVYDVQGRTSEALYAWDLGAQLDPDMQARRSDVYQMLIYWRQYDEALKRLEGERFKPRQFFYQGLVAFKKKLMPDAIKLWNQVLAYSYERLPEGHEEFAEACVRFLRHSLALEMIAPRIEKGMASRRLFLLAGIAWAQKRMLNRATWALDTALRLADMERPRRTRAAGNARVFDARARILYGEVTIDADVREKLDRYFIPKKARQVNH